MRGEVVGGHRIDRGGFDTVGEADLYLEGLEVDGFVDVAADSEGHKSRCAAAVADGMALVTETIGIGLEGQVYGNLAGFSSHELGGIHGRPFDRGLAC